MTKDKGDITVSVKHWFIAGMMALGVTTSASAQTSPAPAPAPPPEETASSAAAAATPAPAQEDDPDLDVNFAQPDFTLAALPTTLRVPRHKKLVSRHAPIRPSARLG